MIREETGWGGGAAALTLLVEEVFALQAAAEAVEGLAGLPDPEPHRVHRLSQACHLPRRRPKSRAADAAEAERCGSARGLGDLEEDRGVGERGGEGRRRNRTEAGNWACSAGVSSVLEELTVLPLGRE